MLTVKLSLSLPFFQGMVVSYFSKINDFAFGTDGQSVWCGHCAFRIFYIRNLKWLIKNALHLCIK